MVPPPQQPDIRRVGGASGNATAAKKTKKARRTSREANFCKGEPRCVFLATEGGAICRPTPLLKNM